MTLIQGFRAPVGPRETASIYGVHLGKKVQGRLEGKNTIIRSRHLQQLIEVHWIEHECKCSPKAFQWRNMTAELFWPISVTKGNFFVALRDGIFPSIITTLLHLLVAVL